MAKRVLIVEDNEHLRQILVSILRFSGYDILEARTGTQAIEKALAAKPNLILLDLDLPDPVGLRSSRHDGYSYSQSNQKELDYCAYPYYCVQRLDQERIARGGAPRGNGRLLTETNPVRTD
jgi:hypothetical protein